MAIGLAWHETRVHRPKQRKRIALFIGLSLMLFFVLASRMGWPSLELFSNPIPALSTVLEGDLTDAPSFGVGLLALGMLLLTLLAGLRHVRDNLFSCMLFGGVAVGAICADMAWAELVLTYILFEGLYGLISVNNRFGGYGLMRRRGIVVVCVLMLTMGFMLGDKQRFLFNQAHGMHRVDQVIAKIGRLTANMRGQTLVASQWPARTMLATRHGALPLPPVRADNPDGFLRQMHGVIFLVYDHHDPRMKAMNRQVAELSNRIKTESILPGGIILRLPGEVLNKP